MTANEWLVMVGALAMPFSGIVGAYLTYRSMNRTTKENTAATLITAAHGVSKDLIAQLSSEVARMREQMRLAEEEHTQQLTALSHSLAEANQKITALTEEVRRLTRQTEDYERVIQERDTLLAQMAGATVVPRQRATANGKRPREKRTS